MQTERTTLPMDFETSERVLREEQQLLRLLASLIRAERPTVRVGQAIRTCEPAFAGDAGG